MYIKVLKIADAEVGYLEKNNNKNLYDKTANAGHNNYTKYAADLISMIGEPYQQGVYWCDMFVDWCFVKAYGVKKAKQLLLGWSAYTPTSADYFKSAKQWYTRNPVPGDIIFFKNSKRIHHTGIVYLVENNRVYTIEGNTSGLKGVVSNGGGVFRKKYNLNDKSIAGYGRPKYVKEEEPMTESERKEFNMLKNEVANLKQQNKIYHYTNELPKEAQPVIQKLLNKGIYAGASESDLNLPESLMRVLIINDRAGLYGN